MGRARAAFPAGDRLAFEPAFSFARVSAGRGSVTAMIFEVGAVYDFTSAHTTYTRPFVAYEYADATSFLGADGLFGVMAGLSFFTK